MSNNITNKPSLRFGLRSSSIRRMKILFMLIALGSMLSASVASAGTPRYFLNIRINNLDFANYGGNDDADLEGEIHVINSLGGIDGDQYVGDCDTGQCTVSYSYHTEITSGHSFTLRIQDNDVLYHDTLLEVKVTIAGSSNGQYLSAWTGVDGSIHNLGSGISIEVIEGSWQTPITEQICPPPGGPGVQPGCTHHIVGWNTHINSAQIKISTLTIVGGGGNGWVFE